MLKKIKTIQSIYIQNMKILSFFLNKNTQSDIVGCL